MIPIHLAPHHFDGTEIPTSLRGTCKLGTASRVKFSHEFSHEFFPLLLACWLPCTGQPLSSLLAASSQEQNQTRELLNRIYLQLRVLYIYSTHRRISNDSPVVTLHACSLRTITILWSPVEARTPKLALKVAWAWIWPSALANPCRLTLV